MYPRSGFRSGGTSECTLVPVFVPGEHPPKPPFWKTPPLLTPPENGSLGLDTTFRRGIVSTFYVAVAAKGGEWSANSMSSCLVSSPGALP